MMTTTKGIVQRRGKNPAALTPLEELIYTYRQQGPTNLQIAKELGGKWTGQNVSTRLTVIKEKLACR